MLAFNYKLIAKIRVNIQAWPRFIISTQLSVLLAIGNCHATGLDDLQQLLGSMDGEEELHLLSVTEEETTIATRSKLNTDYVPGIVTVLRGNVLRARGAATVAEALALVPGIEASHDRIGNQVSLVRGVGGSFASGNMKILLDNISINSALSALANPVLLMPIEQVERIEVIRGPGSALYGEYAYAGVVNIITRRDKQHAFIRADSQGRRSLGGTFSASHPESGLKYTLSLSGWSQSDSNTTAGEDVLHNISIPQGAISNAPGTINDEADYRSALLSLNYKNTSLKAQLLSDGHGDYFGTIDALPTDEEGIAYENQHQTLNLSHLFKSSDNLNVRFDLDWQQYKNRFDFALLPTNYFGIFPNGYLNDGFYRERQLHGGVDLNWQGWRQHNILVGIHLTDIKVRDAWLNSNVDQSSPIPIPLLTKQRFTGDYNWIDEDKERTIKSIVLQDEYSHSDHTTFTLGLRYDHYDDIGESFSPRLAGVYQLSSEHIFKAQYAHAFRPPTFYELWNSASSIEPETIDTYELSYIYRQWDKVHRITLFHSKLKELIVSDQLINFSNVHNAQLSGLEIETEHYMNDWLKLTANISYSDAEDSATGDAIAGAAKLLSNVGLLMESSKGISFSIDSQYVGKRTREEIDPRKSLQGYHTVNTTLSIDWQAVPGATLRLGVKNLFDNDTAYPAPMTFDNTNQTQVVSYQNDYPQPGRTLWLQLSFRH